MDFLAGFGSIMLTFLAGAEVDPVVLVYAVMVETGLNRTEIGKLILAACFVTDLGTVLALGVLFAHSDWRLLVFASVTAISLAVARHFFPKAFRYFQAHIAELEGKVVAATLFTLGGLALAAGSEAVLPAYLLGLTLATTLSDRADVLHKLPSTAYLRDHILAVRAATRHHRPVTVHRARHRGDPERGRAHTHSPGFLPAPAGAASAIH